MKARLIKLKSFFIPTPLALIPLLLALSMAIVACGPRVSSSIRDTNTMTNDDKDAQIIYVAVGDSTGVGVGARDGGYPARLLKRIMQERPQARLNNLCVSGATTADLLRDQLKRAVDARPTLITVGIGINDIGHYVDIETFARNFEEIVKQLKTQTSARIVVSNLPDISFAPIVPVSLREQSRRQVNLFNERISEIAARYQVALVDAYTETHAIMPTHPEFFSQDGFHPSDAGYEYWAKTMWPTVKAAIGE
ncbi:MAG TPA: SGNH/GDSL hydrolase family protein [Pyrinomonadaceae bacterium]